MQNLEIDRTRRVATLVKRELAHLIATELNDTRINSVTVTHVDMSKDLKTAIVFIVAQDRSQDKSTIMAGMTKAARFLRKRLSQTLDLRVTPTIRFRYDESIERASRIDAILKDNAS